MPHLHAVNRAKRRSRQAGKHQARAETLQDRRPDDVVNADRQSEPGHRPQGHPDQKEPDAEPALHQADTLAADDKAADSFDVDPGFAKRFRGRRSIGSVAWWGE